MKKLRVVDLVLGTLMIMMVTLIPAPAWAGWADNQCTFSHGGDPLTSWSKSQAQGYAQKAEHEGYHWGGGCWNDNDSDDQPGDPVQTESTHGEGGDCSGFTFKSWALVNDYGGSGKHHWDKLRYIHGPYTAADFKNPPGHPIDDISKSNATVMEALASSSHVGMIWTPQTSPGADRIIEAKCEACGTLKTIRDYRGDQAYEAAERTGWASCTNCG